MISICGLYGKNLRTRQFLIRPGHVMHNQAEAA
jgi:hypothetical protein